MRVSIPASVSNNGTGLHDGAVEAQTYQYATKCTVVIGVGQGVGEITTKKEALRLAAFLIQAAQRLP